MKIGFLQLKKYLDEKQPACLAVCGNDGYLIDSAIEQIKKSLNIEYEDFNYAVLRETAEAEKIVEACLAVSFMSPRRMVVVRDYQPPKAESEKIKLRDYFYKPNGQTCLVICFSGENAANEYGLDAVDCNKLDTGVLVKWITAKVAKSGRSITAKNAELIAQYCLNDMGRISKETEKLCVYCEDEITAESVNLLVEKESEFVVWELAQEIAAKNPDKAMSCALSLLDKGEEVSSLIASIYALLRRMFYSSVSSASIKELTAALGVKEFAVVKAREAAEGFSQLQLKNALELCRRADEEIKTFNSDKLNVFYGLVLGLLNL